MSSQWKWPDIPGLHDFKGHLVHSAAWDHSYDYSHKRIGIIGNGSSAIQILPQMAKLAGTRIVSFQRGTTWITQSLGEILGANQGDPDPVDQQEIVNGDVGIDMEDVGESDEEIGSNFNPRYTRNDKRRFRNPEKHKQYRKMLQQGMNKGFRIVCHVSFSFAFSPGSRAAEAFDTDQACTRYSSAKDLPKMPDRPKPQSRGCAPR